MPLRKRRRRLLADFGFHCQCTHCEMEGQKQATNLKAPNRKIGVGGTAKNLLSFLPLETAQLRAYLQYQGHGPVFMQKAMGRIADEIEYISSLSARDVDCRKHPVHSLCIEEDR